MVNPKDPAFRGKAEAALIAHAAGDALGWPQEFPNKVLGEHGSPSVTTAFRTWLRRGGGRFYPHEERILAGQYSDDTQLTLAVARCRMLGGSSWFRALTRTELPLWTLYERGGGGATKRAVGTWIKGTPPWAAADSGDVQRYFNAGGNGVAMRVLPHAIFYASEDDPVRLVHDVVTDGTATHGHPRALVGATTYAFAAWSLLRSEHTVSFGEVVQVLQENSHVWGALPATNSARSGWLDAANRSVPHGYENSWSAVVEEMRNLLRRIEQGLKAGAVADDDEILRDLGCFGKAKGAGTIGTAAAVYLCSRYAAQPVQAVLKAAFAHRADTDTLAAMSGGLVGCLAGRDWLPRAWTAVQDYEYLRRMANEVAQGPAAARRGPTALRAVSMKDLDTLRGALAQGRSDRLDLDGSRRAKIADFGILKPLSDSTTAHSWHLQTTDGQSIFVTKLGRKSRSDDSAMEPRRNISRRMSPPNMSEGNRYSGTAIGVKLTVTDLERMSVFYESVLGLPARTSSPRFVSFGALSLVEAKAAVDLSGGAVRPGSDSRQHRILVQVSDVEEAFRRTKRAGACVLQSVTAMPWGDLVFHCQDPEGNLLEVVQSR